MGFLYQLRKNIMFFLPHKTVHTIRYWNEFHKTINWKNPQLYDEKICWLIANIYDEKYGKYADKYQVRSFVEQCGLGNLLVPLVGVFDSVKDINYEQLPDMFILKSTQGSGKDFYEICNNKQNLDLKRIEKKFMKALKYDFAKRSCEYHYHGIKPRIICEELLYDAEHERLTDYKVLCANGKPQTILICANRDKGKDYYSCDWKYLDYVKPEFKSGKQIDKPKCLAEMLHAAEILSKPFPFARIDFYVVHNKLYFGEITLTPSAGIHNDLNEKGQIELGKIMILPIKI